MTSINGSAVLPRADVLEGTAARQTAQDKEEARTIELAQSKLQHFLDNSNENIILCDIGLKKLPDNFFGPLQTLYRDQSPFDPDNAEGETEEEFQARGLIPRLRLNLSNNALEIPPLSLFNLQNITKLDLSHNNLTHLSRHIGKLKNLFSLDISSNRLRWLPWELIQLIELRKLQVIDLDYNPFLQPFLYFGSFGPWHQPCYPPSVSKSRDIEARHWHAPHNVNDAVGRIREFTKTLRQLQMARFQATARKIHGQFPEYDERIYDQAIEHAEWMARFYVNFVVQALSSSSDELMSNKDQPQTTHAASTSVARFGVDGGLLYGQPRCAPSSLPLDEYVFPVTFEKDHLKWTMEQLDEREHIPAEELDSQALRTIFPEPGPSQHEALRKESAVPSLFELALQSATKGSTTGDSKCGVKDLLNEFYEDDPKSVRQGVQTAIDVYEEGGRVCSVCSRSFIIARTEWVEYWHLGPCKPTDNTKIFVPILRRGCSPSCVPAVGS